MEGYRCLLGDDAELIRAYCAEEERVLTDNGDRVDSFFRSKKELCKVDGTVIYIGLSSSTNDKIKYAGKLCNFMKNRGHEAHVVWMYNDVSVFDSDN